MTRPDQLNEERRWLHLFAAHSPELAGARLAQLAPPEPDAAANVGGRVIGIELTHVSGNAASRAREGSRHALLAAMEEAWRATELPPVICDVEWRPGYRPAGRL